MTVSALAHHIPGLSAGEARQYVTALDSDCEARFRVTTTDLSHRLVGSIETHFVDGQINIVDAYVARTLQLGVLDPDRALNVDGLTPVSGVGGLDRLVHLATRVRAHTSPTWREAPAGVFRPVTVQRDGDIVTLEAQSKECLHLNYVSRYTIAKRTNVVSAIRAILRNNGETRVRFPSGHRAVLPAAVQVGGPDDTHMPWPTASRLASSIGMHLYYDLTGYACLEPHTGSPAWRAVEADRPDDALLANTLARVQVTTDLSQVRNRVIVTGRTKATKRAKGRPATKSRTLVATATAPADHPLSPSSLAVNGTAWVNAEIVDQPDIHTQAALKAWADNRVAQVLSLASQVSTSIVPIWHLRRMDLLELVPAHGSPFTFRLTEASIPLGPSPDGMSIGFTRTVRRPTAGRLRRTR